MKLGKKCSDRNPNGIFRLRLFFCKQLALGWQISKQLSELNLFSLSSKKNYRLNKSGVFHL